MVKDKHLHIQATEQISRRINTVIFTMIFTLRHVIIKPLKAKCKKNIESSQRGAAFFIKINLNRVNRCFEKSWKQEECVVKYLKCRKKKSYQPRIIAKQSNHPSKMKFFEGEIKTLSDKDWEFIANRLALKITLKEVL